MEGIKPVEGNEGVPKRLIYVHHWDGKGASLLEIPNDMDLEKEKSNYHDDGGSKESHANLAEWLIQHGAKRLKMEIEFEN